MLLCINIGNSKIDCGFFNFKKDLKSSISYRYILDSLIYNFDISTSNFLTNHLDFSKMITTINTKITHVAICSVVPEIEKKISTIIKNKLSLNPLIVNHDNLKDLASICLNYKGCLGSDRAANIIAASYLYKQDILIIIDIGTATTICVIDNKNKYYLGGLILPGINMQLTSLHTQARQLPYISEVQSNFLGLGTEDQIKNGIYQMHYHAIQGICKQIISIINIKHDNKQLSIFESNLDQTNNKKIKKNKISVSIIGTGGNACLFQSLFDNFNPKLTLIGLYLANFNYHNFGCK